MKYDSSTNHHTEVKFYFSYWGDGHQLKSSNILELEHHARIGVKRWHCVLDILTDTFNRVDPSDRKSVV